MKKIIFLSALFIICIHSAYTQQLEKGQGSFIFDGYEPFADRPVDVQYYIPLTGDIATMPVIFVFEGADRGYDYLVEAWSASAEERGFIFVLPHFDGELYPLRDYQETGVIAADEKEINKTSLQTSALVDEIFKYFKEHAGAGASTYSVYGHSAGGQFVHRFMLFYDSPFVDKAVVGSPGWYTFPDAEQDFPYGVKNIPYINDEAIKRYLSKDITIQLGMADTIRESYLRKTPEAEAQGHNRLERGRAFFAYAQRMALQNNWPFHWTKEEVSGVGHHSVNMGLKALPILLNDSAQNLSAGTIHSVVQPEEVTQEFYQDPSEDHTTPTLRKPVEEGFASTAEITSYLASIVGDHPNLATISSIGTTPGGNQIPILFLGNKKGRKKIRVWIQAALHGNEPAGPESVCMLIDYLLNDDAGQKLLSNFNIAIVPIANVDGYGIQKRKSADDYDLNRDQSKLADPVSVLLKEAYIKWDPEVALDIHEFTPWRKEYDTFFDRKVAIYEDVLFLPTGHPNIPAGIRDFSVNILQKNAASTLEKEGYNWGYYFTPSLKNDKLLLSKGARSPQSSSTNFGLSNTIPVFIEIRGIGLGRTSFARRSKIGFTIALSMLETSAAHRDLLKKTLKQATTETIKRKNDVVVSFNPKKEDYEARFVDFIRKDTFSLALPAINALQCEPLLTRKRPEAYILSDTCTNAIRILETLGLTVKRIEKPITKEVESYVITAVDELPLWEKIYPVRVKSTVIKRTKTFPRGYYIVPLNQKNANYAVTLLEPESDNGFIPFRVVHAQAGKELPIYRVFNLGK